MSSGRLTYSAAGQRRIAYLTRNDVIIWVEGITDVFFYDQVALVVAGSTGISYQVRLADELPDGGAGKSALIAWHNELLQTNNLQGKRGVRASEFFYLDKDLDDVRGNMVKSAHVAYTSTYHFENYCFMKGDVYRASAAVAAIDIGTAQKAIGNVDVWRRNCATEWKDWVYLCVLATVEGLACKANYHSKTSRVHNSCFGGLDKVKFDGMKSELEVLSGLSKGDFETRYNSTVKMVDDIYLRGGYEEIFKGSWYCTMLQKTMEAFCVGRKHRASKIPNSIVSSLLQTIEFGQDWSNELRDPLEAIARLHIA